MEQLSGGGTLWRLQRSHECTDSAQFLFHDEKGFESWELQSVRRELARCRVHCEVFLSDKSNWQQPFVCMTPDRASRLPALPTTTASRSSLADNDDKRKTLVSLADCVEERPMMSSAANYIRPLLQSHTISYQLNPAPWMEAAIPLSAISHNLSNQEYTHIPVSGWQMQVRFRWIWDISRAESS